MAVKDINSFFAGWTIKMSNYISFAKFYDSLTLNVDYFKRTQYLCALFNLYKFSPKLILDLACGTGEMSLYLHDLGFDMIACDYSDAMLSVAQNKATEQNKDILFLHQEMTKLDLYGTVDCVICCLDSINHLILSGNVNKTFEKVSLFLNPGGLFIFDVNTIYKHEYILAENTFVYDLDDVYCVWQNNKIKNNITSINLNFFEKINDNSYLRYSESFMERAYSVNKLSSMLIDSGFEILDIFDELTFEPENDKSQRLYFITRKI